MLELPEGRPAIPVTCCSTPGTACRRYRRNRTRVRCTGRRWTSTRLAGRRVQQVLAVWHRRDCEDAAGPLEIWRADDVGGYIHVTAGSDRCLIVEDAAPHAGYDLGESGRVEAVASERGAPFARWRVRSCSRSSRTSAESCRGGKVHIEGYVQPAVTACFTAPTGCGGLARVYDGASGADACKEVANDVGDLVEVAFQGEVAGLQEMHFGVG